LLIARSGAAPRALLQFIGLSPPLKATDSRRAPGSTLTRVNVLNRYLGYKACKYETKWAPSPNTILPVAAKYLGMTFGQLAASDAQKRRHGNTRATIAQPTSISDNSNWAGRQVSSKTPNRPPHIRKVDVSARFSRCGVETAKSGSEVRASVWQTT
jgi:hypothetical protein